MQGKKAGATLALNQYDPYNVIGLPISMILLREIGIFEWSSLLSSTHKIQIR